MLLIDDVLLAPFRGILWICREIHNAAQEELAGESDSIRMELTSLYMMLETGRISEKEFETQEKKLLDRLDCLENGETELDDAEEDEEEEILQATEGHSVDG
ncbi:MAG: gas vesicle protein GvpG [Acidobacteriota bacterium]